METDNFITENFPSNGQKLKLVGKRFENFLSSVWYLIKQLFHSSLFDMSL